MPMCSISKKEKAQINKWLELNKTKVNQYGDAHGTVYRTNILINQSTGAPKTVHEYIKEKHPTAPWSAIKVTATPPSERTKKAMNKWLRANHLNIYGDPEFTWYTRGENPLIMNGTKVTPEERVNRLFPHKPWKPKKNK